MKLVAPIVALAWVAAGTGSARACEDHDVSVRVEGVAADGSFVVVVRIAGGRVYESVMLYAADGTRRARCELGEAETGVFDAWHCGGDPAFQARRSQSAQQLAAAWGNQLGGATPLVPTFDAPVGVTEAICARVAPVVTMVGTFQCGADNAHVLGHASSRLVFLEQRLTPWRFCGGTSSHEDTVWVSREALAKRLEARTALFGKRKRVELAQHAAEALQWVRSP